MPRQTRRQAAPSFPQIGGAGTTRHVHNKAGEPKFNPSGSPELAMSFPYADLSDPSNYADAAINFAHSLSTAPPESVAEGAVWYPKVRDAVQKGVRTRGFLGGSPNKVLSGAAMVAAVSPNMDWDNSNINAFDEIRGLKGHQWADIMGARTDDSAAGHASRAAARLHVQGLSLSRAPLGGLQKVGRLIQGEDPNDVMNPRTGPKTHRFMHNIADPENEQYATIDGRAFDTITNRAMPWTSGRGIEGANLPSGKLTRYEHAENVVRDVAAAHGMLPSAAQATSWANVKYNIEQVGGRKMGPPRVGQPYYDPYTGEPALHNRS